LRIVTAYISAHTMHITLLFLSLAALLPFSETKHGALFESRGGAVATWYKQTKSRRRAMELDESKVTKNTVTASSFSGLLFEPGDDQEDKCLADEEVLNRNGMEVNRRNSIAFPERFSELHTYSHIRGTRRLRQTDRIFKARESDGKNLGKRSQELDPILASDLARFSLFPIQNKRAWEMYKMHVASFWTTEEVDLGMDIHDWQNKLNDDERHFIEMVLAFFAGNPFYSVGDNIPQVVFSRLFTVPSVCYLIRCRWNSNGKPGV
jgi:Ribonucleotide reductase, small chain